MAVGSSCCEAGINGRNPSVKGERGEGAKTSHYDPMEWATFVLQERDKGER